jgi:hypothetical protein
MSTKLYGGLLRAHAATCKVLAYYSTKFKAKEKYYEYTFTFCDISVVFELHEC